MDHDAELDTCGLICPLPVLKLRKRLQDLPEGTVLAVHTDDPVALIDIPNFCREAGHEVLEQRTNGSVQTFLIGKKAGLGGTPQG